jgi:hypothetical protein
LGWWHNTQLGAPALRPVALPAKTERVVGVVRGGCHRQADHDAGALVEAARRKHQHRVRVAHLAPELRVEVDPDHILTLW